MKNINWTDGQIDGWTEVKQYTPSFSKRDIINDYIPSGLSGTAALSITAGSLNPSAFSA